MKQINENEWFTEVTCSSVPVAVAFFADWSPSCRDIEGILEEYEESEGNMKFVKVDIDENKDLRVSQRVIAPPTVIIYYKGVPLSGIPGSQPEHVYDNRISRAVRLYQKSLCKKSSWRPVKA